MPNLRKESNQRKETPPKLYNNIYFNYIYIIKINTVYIFNIITWIIKGSIFIIIYIIYIYRIYVL